MNPARGPRLIVISDSERAPQQTWFEQLERLLGGAGPGSVLVLLRDRQLPIRARQQLGQRLRQLTRAFGQWLSVSDRLDLAALLEADGVHLSEDSVSVADARALGVSLGRSWYVSAACHAPETIVASALAREPAAQAAARLFVRLLGRFAGGLALTFKALGGVYIAGGVASGLGPLLDEPQFRAAFEAHPPHQALLETIPTLLITCEEPGLIGCAAHAHEHALTT